MGLLNQLREFESIENRFFHPSFMHVVERGKAYLMSVKELEDLRVECLTRTKETFETWMKHKGIKTTGCNTAFIWVTKK